MLAEILSTASEVTVVDMEAGLEHLARAGGTLASVDKLLVVVEPYLKALETGRRTVALARELGIPEVLIVASKVRDGEELEMVRGLAAASGAELVAALPFDEDARLADRAGRPVLEAAPQGPLVKAVEELARRLDS